MSSLALQCILQCGQCLSQIKTVWKASIVKAKDGELNEAVLNENNSGCGGLLCLISRSLNRRYSQDVVSSTSLNMNAMSLMKLIQAG